MKECIYPIDLCQLYRRLISKKCFPYSFLFFRLGESHNQIYEQQLSHSLLLNLYRNKLYIFWKVGKIHLFLIVFTLTIILLLKIRYCINCPRLLMIGGFLNLVKSLKGNHFLNIFIIFRIYSLLVSLAYILQYLI